MAVITKCNFCIGFDIAKLFLKESAKAVADLKVSNTLEFSKEYPSDYVVTEGNVAEKIVKKIMLNISGGRFRKKVVIFNVKSIVT